MNNVRLSTKAARDLERLRDFLYHQTRSRQVLRKFDREFENAKDSISKNPSGYPLLEHNKKIRKKYQWKYWYFLLIIQMKSSFKGFFMRVRTGWII